jgi:hypothetical protein
MVPQPDVIGGELQTLISTLQNGNVQLGNIFQALGGVRPALNDLGARLNAIAQGTLPLQMGGVTTSAPLGAPEGYVTVNIPGVGPRLIAYWPAP